MFGLNCVTPPYSRGFLQRGIVETLITKILMKSR